MTTASTECPACWWKRQPKQEGDTRPYVPLPCHLCGELPPGTEAIPDAVVTDEMRAFHHAWKAGVGYGRRDGAGLTPEHIEALRGFVPRDTTKNRTGLGVADKRRLRLANEALRALGVR